MAELSIAARRDPLTGLLNRRAVYEMAEHELARALRSGRPIAIAYLDLDDLKRVNDTDGHEAGDELISRFAAALRMATRESDLVGRFGGDEFVVVMPDTDYAAGVTAIERLLSGDMVPRASCGIVATERPDLSLEKLIAAADELM
jgi:diguanylate cyclase (GGDEF)-like protein